VRAEDFDEGGEGVAYHDVSPGNNGNAYRATDVDIQATSDAGGGYNVGWMGLGEWLVYSVTVPNPGEYRLNLRVASNGTGGHFHVEFDNADRTGPIAIPNTGGWQRWTTVSAPVTLSAGLQRMRVVVDAASANGIVGNLNYIEIVSAPNALPTVTLTEPSSGTAFLAPATISMAATASDSDGNVTRVDFYAGTTFLGSDTSSPYTFRWENVAPLRPSRKHDIDTSGLTGGCRRVPGHSFDCRADDGRTLCRYAADQIATACVGERERGGRIHIRLIVDQYAWHWSLSCRRVL
jgi:hypothetical protein